MLRILGVFGGILVGTMGGRKNDGLMLVLMIGDGRRLSELAVGAVCRNVRLPVSLRNPGQSLVPIGDSVYGPARVAPPRVIDVADAG
jgi:hypothetical protein